MTLPQHMQALAYGEEVRMSRAGLRREIRGMSRDASPLRLAEVLAADIPSWLAGAPIVKVMTWVRQFGTFRAERILNRHHIGLGRTVGDLTLRQRLLIVGELGVHAEEVAEPEPPPAKKPVRVSSDFCPRCNTTVVPKPFDVCPWCDTTLTEQAA